MHTGSEPSLRHWAVAELGQTGTPCDSSPAGWRRNSSLTQSPKKSMGLRFKLENLQAMRWAASSEMSKWVISNVCACSHTIFNSLPATVHLSEYIYIYILRNIKGITEKTRWARTQTENRHRKKGCYSLCWPLDISFLTSFGVLQHFSCSPTIAMPSLNSFEALLGILVQSCKGTQGSTWSGNTQWKFITENIMWASNRSAGEDT